MRYMFSGGGTGGHIYPALAIISALRECDPTSEFLYVGTESGREAAVVPKEGIPFATVSSAGFVNLGIKQKITGGLKALKGILDAMGHIRRFRPDVVVGTGGFVAGPVLLAARLLGRPVVIQEQNAFPGVTNRIASRWARTVFVPYEEAKPHFPAGAKLQMIGNPVRRDVAAATRPQARRAFGFSESDKVLVIMGGSGGGRDFHRFVVAAMRELKDVAGLKVLHITGERYLEQVNELYGGGQPGVTIVPYLHNMPEAYAAADAGVFRAGAITLAELQVRGLPPVLIPSPNVTHNHQEWNARTLEKRGAALVVREKEMTAQRLADAIRSALGDRGPLLSAALLGLAQPEAGVAIATEIVKIARGK